MNSQLLFNFKIRISSLLFIISIFYCSFYKAQPISITSVAFCTKLAIQSAELADKSHYFSEKSYFETKPIISANNRDSALICIKESIVYLDSVLILASDSSVLGIKHTNIARNFAIDSYRALMQSKNTSNYRQKKEFLKNATYYAENTTVDAYHASFYLSDGEKKQKKEKHVTKLDIDQTLFTLLRENLKEKSNANKQQILKLSDELSKTKNPAKVSELKTQLQTLELQGKYFDKESNDAQIKLSDINIQIETRDKNATTNHQKDTIFSKTISQKNTEWNNAGNFETEIPNFLVYQVQLSVLKNNAQIEDFKGFTPIYSNKTENGVSYSTGLFEKFEDAREAEKTIHSIGLTDAFIVAYYNKKKITLDEARKLEKK